MGYARVETCGNLTRDVEIKYLPSGDAIAEFGIAVNDGTKDKNHVSFIDCAAWGKRGETIAKFFSKGDPIILYGNLRMEDWESRDGQKRSKLKLRVNGFEFIPAKREQRDPMDQSAPVCPEDVSQDASHDTATDPDSGDHLPF